MKRFFVFALLSVISFTASAKDICLQDDFGLMYKFKAPKLPKKGAAVIVGKFIIPETVSGQGYNDFGNLSGTVIDFGDGYVQFEIEGHDIFRNYSGSFTVNALKGYYPTDIWVSEVETPAGSSFNSNLQAIWCGSVPTYF